MTHLNPSQISADSLVIRGLSIRERIDWLMEHAWCHRAEFHGLKEKLHVRSAVMVW